MHELHYWKSRYDTETGTLGNSHYEFFYTSFFGISAAEFSGKRVLDIGCGPRGSLEWLRDAKECVGLDPSADQYQKLGARNHRMKYVNAVSEVIPYPAQYFDIITSFNSLDHVGNIERTLKEIARVCKTEGLFLLITEFGHLATPAEPQEFDLDIIDEISVEFRLEGKRVFGMSPDHNIYGSLRDRLPYDSGSGILCAKFVRTPP